MDLFPILNLLNLGVAIVTTQAKVIVVNKSAIAILRSSGVLSVFHGRLQARSIAHNNALTGAIGRVGAGPNAAPVGFSISRTGQRPLSVVVASILRKDTRTSRSTTKHIAVLMSDPELQDVLEPALAGSLFDFTPAESMISALLMQAKSTTEIAEKLEITAHTVRNHLKRMFAKTNTRGQSELLYVLLRSPAFLRFNDET